MSEPYNELMQVKMAIKAAERMVGQATMSMDENQLKAATDAVNEAKKQFQKALLYETGVDHQFLEVSAELIEKIEHQLEQAKSNDEE